jgi:hypothetical protein
MWRALARSKRAAARPTAPWRALPDYLIAGGQRCGTTSLQRYLIEHPHVAPAGLMKGVHYFDTNDYHRGLDWYRSHFPTRRYLTSMADRIGGTVITGESSPYYMFHPLAPARIATDLPAARIVVLLRDPVDRAYSQFLHERRRGYENLEFEPALEAEEDRLCGEAERMLADPYYDSFSLRHHSYMARGVYFSQVRHLADLVGEERLLVVSSEQMFADPAATYHRVVRFLGLPEFTPEGFAAQNANVYTSPISAHARGMLEDRFREPNKLLYDLVGEDFGWSG